MNSLHGQCAEMHEFIARPMCRNAMNSLHGQCAEMHEFVARPMCRNAMNSLHGQCAEMLCFHYSLTSRCDHFSDRPTDDASIVPEYQQNTNH